MNHSFHKWIHQQTDAVFRGVGTHGRKKHGPKFSLFLALPFFFVPILIAGYVVAQVGESLSKEAVAYLHSIEEHPEHPQRVVTYKHVRRAQKRSLALTESKTIQKD